jgi:hypothetical protein
LDTDSAIQETQTASHGFKTASLAFAVMVLRAACGGGVSSGQPTGSTKVTLTEFRFDPSGISVPHGALFTRT